MRESRERVSGMRRREEGMRIVKEIIILLFISIFPTIRDLRWSGPVWEIKLGKNKKGSNDMSLAVFQGWMIKLINNACFHFIYLKSKSSISFIGQDKEKIYQILYIFLNTQNYFFLQNTVFIT